MTYICKFGDKVLEIKVMLQKPISTQILNQTLLHQKLISRNMQHRATFNRMFCRGNMQYCWLNLECWVKSCLV